MVVPIENQKNIKNVLRSGATKLFGVDSLGRAAFRNVADFLTWEALGGKADKENAALEGQPTAPTPNTADKSDRLATTAYVKDALAAITPVERSTAEEVADGVLNDKYVTPAGLKPSLDKTRITSMEEKADAVTYETLTALGEDDTDNEKVAVKRLFEPGGTMAFKVLSDAQVAEIPAAVRRTVIDDVNYVRSAEEPSHDLKFRSADRWTDDGDHDSANGGWWMVDGTKPFAFATRGELLGAQAGINGILYDGQIATANGIPYMRQRGAALIPDMPGWLPAGELYVEHFGNVTVMDNGDLLATAITAAANGKAKLRAKSALLPVVTPVKTYHYDGEIVDVDFSGTIIAPTAEFPAGEMVLRINAMDEGLRLSWSGGEIDGRLMPGLVPGFAPDLLRIHGPWEHVIIKRGVFRNNDEGGAAGDSGVIAYGAKNIYIDDCDFFGAVDASIYVSGDPLTGVGENLHVTRCRFQYANVGVIAKREFKHTTCDGNDFIDCLYGTIIGGEADLTLLPGKRGRISGNRYTRVTYPIEARISDYTLIYGNRIEEWGDIAGSPVNAGAIVLRGSKHCQVFGNVIQRSTASHASAAAVRVQQFIYAGSTYNSEYNQVFGNNIKNAAFGIQEGTGSGYNLYGPNLFLAVTTPHTIVGGLTEVFQPPRKTTPASATAAGIRGEIAYNDSYLYIATSTNAWKRVAIATW
ncbi:MULTISPECIES: right-handed parallel beta-helix repeat-containing protein [unclassified Shinella]|uniref:right-handed parallel beta-helix repeat-containing protein n=1 Tax=unclassified Shinella TaxID=2643062 RepID=UPI00225C783D|nr:hypothetical protein SHINE37_44647 [Rhizobiaceae bacterium]CAK7259127.1 protein of unknown function [Shinella sp. WSC3-e]